MSVVIIVRHAQAGMAANDMDRPLSAVGEWQARALAARFTDFTPQRLLCSPAARCRLTLEPLSHRLQLTIETDVRLRMAADPGAVLGLVDACPPDGTLLLCSHGDVIPDVIAALAQRAGASNTPRNGPPASSWVYRTDAMGTHLEYGESPQP